MNISKHITVLRVILFALCVGVVITLSSYADDPPGVFSISREDLMKDHGEYVRTIKKMRASLGGSTPKEFYVDGHRYVGNFVVEGGSTDIYRVIEDGKAYTLRIPQDFNGWGKSFPFVKANGVAVLHDAPIAEVIAPHTRADLATKTRWEEGFKSAREVVRDYVKNPNSAAAREEMNALKALMKKYGSVHFDGMHPGDYGVAIDPKTGKLSGTFIEFPNKKNAFEPIAAGEESWVEGAFEDLRGSKGTQIADELGISKAEFGAHLNQLEKEIIPSLPPRFPAEHVPEIAIPKPAVPLAAVAEEEGTTCTARMMKTESTDLLFKNTMAKTSMIAENLNVAGFALAVVDLDMNPFAVHDDGYPCSQANAMKNRIYCEWDNPLNPWNDGVTCSVITDVRPLGHKAYNSKAHRQEDSCGLVYDRMEFDVSEKYRISGTAAKAAFDDSGLALGKRSTDDFMKEFRAKWRATKPVLHKDVENPPRSPYEG